MTKPAACKAQPAHQTPFHYQRGTDGVDETFDVVCHENGLTVASFHYWDKEEAAKRLASNCVNALNEFYASGAYLHVSNFLDAHKRLHAGNCEAVGNQQPPCPDSK